jgi:CheY-like chemotaxis protein
MLSGNGGGGIIKRKKKRGLVLPFAGGGTPETFSIQLENSDIWRKLMSRARKKILIVDDSTSTVMFMKIVLKRMGFDVCSAPNGLEGLRRVQQDSPDLVILDLSMPVMDGRTMLKKLRENNGSADLPVVIASVDESEETLTEIARLGISAYMKKPIKLDNLHAVIEEVLFSPVGAGRRCLRSPYHERVVLRSGGVSRQLLAENLSEGGIYVRKEDPLETGTPVKVTFALGKEGLLALAGRVIYQRTSQEGLSTKPPGMAIEFDEMPAYAARLLKAFIEKQLAGDLIESEDEGQRAQDTEEQRTPAPEPLTLE